MSLRLFLPGLLALLSTHKMWAQVADDFSDGNFTVSPPWVGNDNLFVVVDDAGNQRLRSNSAGAANYYLSTPSSIVNDVQWEFFVDLRFATSGANYVDVYLMSNAADLSVGVNGYHVRVGGTADAVELFRSDAGVSTSLGVVGPAVVTSSTSNPFRIKATRSATGTWNLLYDDGATGTYVTAGSVTDNVYTSATHFGIRIEQSSAASVLNKHFFDDITVQLIGVDATPPSIVSVTAVNATEVDVLFTEALDPSFIGSYDITPSVGVAGQLLDGVNAALVHVTPGIALTSGGTYQLAASGAQDLAGNAMLAGPPIGFSYSVAEQAAFRDVVINEIMADPSPALGLPDAEFVELLNTTTDRTFELGGWSFSDGGTPVLIPAFTLGPGEYVVLMAAASLPLFPAVTNKIGLTSLPALNNDGDPLTLRDANALIMDGVQYALSWYQDGVKDDGGWTLEQIDPTSPCSGASNWRASVAPAGGTPGIVNSIFAIVPDTQAPSLLSVTVNDANTIGLVFDEPMDAASLLTATYAITPAVDVASALPNGSNAVTLTLQTPLVVGTVYTIVVDGCRDCPGNPIGTANTGTFALPEPVAVGDVVINEVLYDPFGTGSDFVEVYNRSQKTLSIADWKLASVSDGEVSVGLPITSTSFLLLPGEYVVVCENTGNVLDNYPQGRVQRFVETDIPSYNNGEGSVVLQDPTGTQLDRFDYSDELHFSLVNNPEGYSLERVDPDRPTDDKTNWQTAADVAGKATPGFVNSQYAKAPSATGELLIEPSIFSPDNDGYQDLLTIAYTFKEPGFVGNMSAYDMAGREARKLMQNQLLGTEGAISWNGILDSGSLGRMGPYIIVLEVFDLAGNVERFKKTVTLAHRLD